MSNPATKASEKPGLSTSGYFFVLLIGIYLGILFTKSEVARWERVHDMFLFREFHMYGIISIAILVSAIAMVVIKSMKARSLEGSVIKYSPKPFHTGIIIGGICFGAGWAITGACPGPIYAQIGAGQSMALLTLIGALLGMYTYAYLKPKLPH